MGGPSLALRGPVLNVPFGAGVVYTASLLAFHHVTAPLAEPTFWEEPRLAIAQMPAQEPAISELIIALYELDSIAFA